MFNIPTTEKRIKSAFNAGVVDRDKSQDLWDKRSHGYNNYINSEGEYGSSVEFIVYHTSYYDDGKASTQGVSVVYADTLEEVIKMASNSLKYGTISIEIYEVDQQKETWAEMLIREDKEKKEKKEYALEQSMLLQEMGIYSLDAVA